MTPSTLPTLIDGLRAIRIDPARLETGIHDDIAAMMTARGIAYRHEVTLGPRCRVDFLVDGVVIEVKKGKASSPDVIAQIERYCGFGDVHAVILVVERNIFRLPAQINGKPVEYVPLSANWGIAL